MSHNRKQSRAMKLGIQQSVNHSHKRLADAKVTEANGWIVFLVLGIALAAAVVFI